MDSGFFASWNWIFECNCLVDSGFLKLYSGFPRLESWIPQKKMTGFRIPREKKFPDPNARFRYMVRCTATQQNVQSTEFLEDLQTIIIIVYHNCFKRNFNCFVSIELKCLKLSPVKTAKIGLLMDLDSSLFKLTSERFLKVLNNLNKD